MIYSYDIILNKIPIKMIEESSIKKRNDGGVLHALKDFQTAKIWEQ